jgi:hypothetical protein
MTRRVIVRTRRIWHAEVAAVGAALRARGAWQTALRVRVAHRQALAHRPDGTAFDFRPTAEDAGALAEVLEALRGRVPSQRS